MLLIKTFEGPIGPAAMAMPYRESDLVR